MVVNDQCDAVMMRNFKKRSILEQMHAYEAVFAVKSHILIF
jgi:hypothetical protein